MTTGQSNIAGVDVSRETIERLKLFVSLLHKWSPRINLVSSTTLSEAWSRHVLDSAQLMRYCRSVRGEWLDFGSGAGFPALVCAVIAQETHPDISFTLVESDQRKCAFLRTVSRELGIVASIVPKRIEAMIPQGADIISARAVMNLNALLEVAAVHGKSTAQALFLKGERWEDEALAAREKWRFRYEAHPSITHKNAVVLEIHELSHA